MFPPPNSEWASKEMITVLSMAYVHTVAINKLDKCQPRGNLPSFQGFNTWSSFPAPISIVWYNEEMELQTEANNAFQHLIKHLIKLPNLLPSSDVSKRQELSILMSQILLSWEGFLSALAKQEFKPVATLLQGEPRLSGTYWYGLFFVKNNHNLNYWMNLVDFFCYQFQIGLWWGLLITTSRDCLQIHHSYYKGLSLLEIVA